MLRLPGALNTKKPARSSCHSSTPAARATRSQSLEQLGAGFAPEEEDTGNGYRPARPSGDWARLIRDGAASGDRHERNWQLAGYLLRREIDPEVALELVQAFNLARVRPPYDEGERPAAV